MDMKPLIENPSIRRAEAADIPRIRAIMDEAVAALPSRDWYVDDDAAYLARHISRDGYLLVYDISGEIAGFLLVRYPKYDQDNLGVYLHLPREEYPLVAHMESAAVALPYRGRHIQCQLLTEAIALEQKMGRTRHLMATVHPDNRYSFASLSQCGFLPVTTLKKYGDWVRTVMHRPLTDTPQTP